VECGPGIDHRGPTARSRNRPVGQPVLTKRSAAANKRWTAIRKAFAEFRKQHPDASLNDYWNAKKASKI